MNQHPRVTDRAVFGELSMSTAPPAPPPTKPEPKPEPESPPPSKPPPSPTGLAGLARTGAAPTQGPTAYPRGIGANASNRRQAVIAIRKLANRAAARTID